MNDENRMNKNEIDALLKNHLSNDDIPPDVEKRLQDRLEQFRSRVDAESADVSSHHRIPLFWKLTIAGSIAAAMIVAAVGLNILGPPSVKKRVTRSSSDSRSLALGIEAYSYNPTNGTVSAGDVFRVPQGPPAISGNQVAAWYGGVDGGGGSDDFFTPQRSRYGHNTESYDSIEERGFSSVNDHPLSTFSIDVDTASYSNIRRFLNQGRLPPRGAVRIEEMINYFTYEYPEPEGEHPFSVTTELAGCPWNETHLLLRIGLKGRSIDTGNRPPSNLVFLLDVSGSMNAGNKLPLVKRALKVLVSQLEENDQVAIVVYAGASGLALPSTSGGDKHKILDALENLHAGGSTNGGEGIMLAYETAARNFIKGGINRVILCTDGDFNMGITDRSELTRLIEREAKTNIFLSILGFGEGNLKDAAMEELTNKGNGNYSYIDTLNEAKKVLVDQMGGTLVTIAKDVKIQLEFNPVEVASYRLIGYENRMLRKEDFNDDKKDAGEIGAGHTVTAIYEIVPRGAAEYEEPSLVDNLKYQGKSVTSNAALSGEIATVKLRYKEPEGDTSTLLEIPVQDLGLSLDEVGDDFRFASAVAAFGMILRDSKYKGTVTLEDVLSLGESGIGEDPHGYRAEFIELLKKAKTLKNPGYTPMVP